MLYISDIVKGTYTNIDGVSLYCALISYLSNDQVIEVSFKGIGPLSSSFFNSSFGSLIEEFGIEKFKKIVKPVEITHSQGELIRRYINSVLTD